MTSAEAIRHSDKHSGKHSDKGTSFFAGAFCVHIYADILPRIPTGSSSRPRPHDLDLDLA